MHRICFVAFDTTCCISVDDDSRLDMDALLSKGCEIAFSVQATLNMFDANSELSRMCSGYLPGVPYPVSDMLFDFLKINLDLARMTGGIFDPTIAPVTKLWRFSGDMEEKPDADLLNAALSRVGYERISLLHEEKSVVFSRSGIELDPGATGKGFALGLVANYLKSAGVESGFLDFGGNVYVLGEKKEGGRTRPWAVAIADPDNKNEIFGGVHLVNAGIATTSWYEHYHRIGGKIYHHILDTKSGMPCPLKLKSASVISSSAVLTDLLSTPLFLLGPSQGCDLMKKIRIETNEAVEYVIVCNDHSILASPGSRFTACT